MAPSSLYCWWRSLRRSQPPSRDAGILLPTEAAPPVALDAVAPTPASNYRLDPTEAKRQIDRIPRFRILIMGRANAGKTTVLQRVCNTTDQPAIFDGNGEKVDTRAVQGSLGRGYHNIEDELVFKSNPRYVFHDSCGFEAGSEAEFDEMKKFVTDQAKSTKLEKRLHAIWYCIPLNESHRMVMAAERKFFNECDSGHVPVIVLLTKADTLNLDAVQQLMRRGLTVDDAMKEAPEVEKQLQKSCLEKIKGWLNELKFPPQSYLRLTGMEQDSAECEELLKCTANALTEEGLQGLLISSQQSNLGLCMEFAIMKTLKRSMNKGADQIRLDELAHALGTWFPFVSNQCFVMDFFLDFFLEEVFERRRRRCAQSIKHGSYSISIPTLSMSSQPSLMALAEHGIGCVIVFECLFFQLQVKDGADARKDLQQDLTEIVRKYQKSGVQNAVIAHIAAAFQQHGESVDDLCPMLVGIAQENQMCKTYSLPQ
ncbi:hypothetical protein BKA82DRAFT_4178705 [Pisolithus tinctorius]|nr:hypothetical protein BKA82DRAFT_4178705 [Pisolithus tinctorius]